MKQFSLPLLIAVFMLSACATTPLPSSEARAVPPEQSYYPNAYGASTATVVFVRDSGGGEMGLVALMVHQLWINGEKAASLYRGETVTFHLLQGDYIFGATIGGFRGDEAFVIDQKLEAGRTYFYRIRTDGNDARPITQRTFEKPM